MTTKKSFVVFSVYYKHGEYSVSTIEGEDALRDYLYDNIIDYLNDKLCEESSNFDEQSSEVDEQTEKRVKKFVMCSPLNDVINSVLTIGAERIDNQEGYGIVSIVEGVVVEPSGNEQNVCEFLSKKE